MNIERGKLSVKLSKLIKNLSFLASGIFVFVLGLVKYIKSASVEDYGADGKEFVADNNYLIMLLVGLIVVSYFGYELYILLTKKEAYRYASVLASITSTSLCSFYTLGVFFKALFKAMAKGKEFVFVDYSSYLFIGIIALFLLVASCANYFVLKDKKEN
jgi:hypothetical protein